MMRMAHIFHFYDYPFNLCVLVYVVFILCSNLTCIHVSVYSEFLV